MEIKEILKALDYHTITAKELDVKDDLRFERNILFTVLGKNYEIEWWRNISYLFYDDLQIPFERVTRSNSWPNGAKMNLQFYSERGNVNCILKIES